MPTPLLRTAAAVLLLAALLTSACVESPVTTSPEPEPEAVPGARIDTALAARIDGFLATVPADAPGLSVLVRHNDEVVYYGARGLANAHTGRELTVHSRFRLASVSKTFTAVAVMQLVERGTLGLDESVLTYFPEFDASWEPMTIRMLLSHRAGTYDFLADFRGSPWRQGLDNQRVIDYFAEHPTLKFTPGTEIRYSNSNYLLLAEIVSRVTGVPFARYMDEQFFEPLGMTTTYCRDAEVPLGEDEVLNFAERETYFGIRTYTLGAMGMVSSAYEVDLFMRALARGELLNEGSMAQMRVPYGTLFGVSYGLGLMFGDDWYGHGGSLDGFQTTIAVYPQRNAHLVLLSNGGERTSGYLREVASIVEAYY